MKKKFDNIQKKDERCGKLRKILMQVRNVDKLKVILDCIERVVDDQGPDDETSVISEDEGSMIAHKVRWI